MTNLEGGEDCNLLSIYDGFFSGGARILHTDVLVGLHQSGYPQSVLSIHEEIEREATIQRIYDDYCFRALQEEGIAVSSLGRRLRAGEVSPDASADELALLQQSVDDADVVFSLKEQPLKFVKEIETRSKPVIACLHRSDPENQGDSLEDLMTTITLGKLTLCICCSDATKEAYQTVGVPEAMLEVITNGIDLSRFNIAPDKRQEMRRTLDIPGSSPTVLFAGRYDAIKNIPLFLESAKIFLKAEKQAHVVMCGAGITLENDRFRDDMTVSFRSDEDLSRMHVLGLRCDMDSVYAAADVVSLTSLSEAYPLCLIEGLASGAVPVSTDVGDCRAIVKDCGLITEYEPTEIAAAWQNAIDTREERLDKMRHTRDDFDRLKMIEAYAHTIERLYHEDKYLVAS